jgi:protein-S-isoprenylcysteine O-methyltransferase Ste14
VISPLAVLIVLAAGALQYRRMINEEKILKAAFPEYRAYAARTPLVLPAGLAALCGRSGPA